MACTWPVHPWIFLQIRDNFSVPKCSTLYTWAGLLSFLFPLASVAEPLLTSLVPPYMLIKYLDKASASLRDINLEYCMFGINIEIRYLNFRKGVHPTKIKHTLVDKHRWIYIITLYINKFAVYISKIFTGPRTCICNNRIIARHGVAAAIGIGKKKTEKK